MKNARKKKHKMRHKKKKNQGVGNVSSLSYSSKDKTRHMIDRLLERAPSDDSSFTYKKFKKMKDSGEAVVVEKTKNTQRLFLKEKRVVVVITTSKKKSISIWRKMKGEKQWMKK